ncbi:MAG: hypothetical protein FWD71_00120 [Oscillospiraceae bacterium]|nr:hypothetical protein [Oscillospiraceae bacterium]
MIVNIANYDFPGMWDNTYYFALSDYPTISDWELRKLILFVDYEKSHGRETEIICESNEITQAVNNALANPASFLSAQKPDIITECTACRQKGCLADYLCHTASIENAKSIFRCGKLLSAVKARNKTREELAEEPRNAAKDPPDYFDYIMMAWGNCQAGDRLVMERLLCRFPDEYDLSVDFKPGVRFYFKYTVLENHRDFTNDGMHPAKIKNELLLSDYLYCCIIPENNRSEFENIIPPYLVNRIFYIENDCRDIWDWSEKVYNFVLKQKVVL